MAQSDSYKKSKPQVDLASELQKKISDDLINNIKSIEQRGNERRGNIKDGIRKPGKKIPL